jgi:hypothetical protein
MNELVPSEFFVSQNYPNPFKERTKIKYCVAYKTRVQITVYNSEGEEIEKLVDETKQPGAYEVEFSPRHSGGNWNLNGSAYSYRLEAGDYKSEKTMQLLK